jgi:hypothetical protein
MKRVCSQCPFIFILKSLRSSETLRHFRMARKEFLLGIRSILDDIIESLEEEKKEEKKDAKKVKIS